MSSASCVVRTDPSISLGTTSNSQLLKLSDTSSEDNNVTSMGVSAVIVVCFIVCFVVGFVVGFVVLDGFFGCFFVGFVIDVVVV